MSAPAESEDPGSSASGLEGPVATRVIGLHVDPLARCDSDTVGDGTVIWAFAHVAAGAIVGASCKIGEHSYIEGGSTIGDRVTVKNGALIWSGVHVGDDVFLGPRVTFTNDPRPRAHQQLAESDLVPTTVRSGATLGASVTVVCGITIGENAMVGAGTLVHRDVPAHALVVGVPGRQIGWVCRCGTRLDARCSCPCGRRYDLGGRSGLVEIEPPVMREIQPEPEPEPVQWAPV